MLRNAFASTLRFMRSHRAVQQSDFGTGISQSHISRLEQAQTSVTLERVEEIAAQLNMHPLSLLAMVWGANEQRPAEELLDRARAELLSIDGLDHPVPIDDKPATHPRILEAERLREEVQRLKQAGHTKAEISRILNIARSTAARHW